MCAIGGMCDETSQEMDPGLPDIPEESEAPEVVVPRPPSPNIISEAMPAVGYACVPLPRQQWCDTRTGTNACFPSDNGTDY